METQLITREYFESKIIMIQDEDKNVWFKGFDVASILGYSNKDKAVRMHVDEEDKIKLKELQGTQKSGVAKMPPHTIFINDKGVRSLICKSKLINASHLARALKIEVCNHKYETKESETIGAIKKVFNGEIMREQYIILNYRVDLYFPNYNLVIECDEFNHKDRCPIKENNRYEVTFSQSKYLNNVL